MRAILYCIFILLSCCTQLHAVITTPNLGQTQYRWRNNDGNQTAATWRAPVNTPIAVPSVQDTFRLRIELANTGTGAAALTQTLEYSSNGGTTWTVMNNPATNAFTYQASTYVANGAATTNQMGTATAGTFAAGKIVSAPAAAVNLAAAGRTEYEWVIRPTANALPSTTYTFRSSGQQATPVVYPTLTMACAGKPTPGAIGMVSPVVTCNTTTTLNLSGNTEGPGISYQWQYNNTGTWVNFGTSAVTITTPSITQATQFRCALTCANGGASDTTAPTTISPLPLHIDLGNDINRCLDEDGVIILDAGTVPNSPVYLWDDGTGGQVRAVGATGTYSVRVTDEFTCTGTDTIKVIVRKNPRVELGNDTTVCNGVNLTLDAGTDGTSYFWNTGAGTQVITVNSPGDYIAFVTNNEACVKIDTIKVNMSGELPSVQGITIDNNGQYTFRFSAVNPLNVVGYEWNFGDGSPHSFLQSPIYTYANPGNYIVVLKIQSTCGSVTDSTSAMILGLNQIDVDMQELMVYPNPVRQTATIQNRGSLKMEKIAVVNISGQVVYRADADSKDKHTLRLNGLAAGLYTVAITTDKGTVIRKIELLP